MLNDTDWGPVLSDYLETRAWRNLQDSVGRERQRYEVFPPPEFTYRAFELTPYAQVRVVILGQDPYHGAGQAHGLCFSVLPGVKPPPSLRNILKELAADTGTDPAGDPNCGCLAGWAEQGVFLLNTVLTVRAGEANSHRQLGWTEFTDHVISKLDEHPRDLVFVLWGKPAEKKRQRIGQRHRVLAAPHPSPLSAHRGFFGSRPFSQINQILQARGEAPIDWSLSENVGQDRMKPGVESPSG